MKSRAASICIIWPKGPSYYIIYIRIYVWFSNDGKWLSEIRDLWRYGYLWNIITIVFHLWFSSIITMVFHITYYPKIYVFSNKASSADLERRSQPHAPQFPCRESAKLHLSGSASACWDPYSTQQLGTYPKDMAILLRKCGFYIIFWETRGFNMISCVLIMDLCGYSPHFQTQPL